jgi:hypothetical protein
MNLTGYLNKEIEELQYIIKQYIKCLRGENTKMIYKNRLYRTIGFFIFILSIVYIFLNLQIKSIIKIKELEVKKLKILDSKNNVKILIDTDNNGNPRMYFFDEKGKIRISILITPKGYASIGLGDTKQRLRTTISVKEHPAIGLYDVEGNAIFTLDVFPDTAAFLVFFTKEGKIKATIGKDKNNSGVLQLFDSNDKPLIKFKTQKTKFND